MTTFKAKGRATRLPFCSTAQLNKFIDTRIDAWETNKRSPEEVHEKCELLMKNAAEGTLTIGGKAVYARTLGAKLKELGCFMTEAPSKEEDASLYD